MKALAGMDNNKKDLDEIKFSSRSFLVYIRNFRNNEKAMETI